MKEKSVTFKSGLFDSMEITTETSSMWAVLLSLFFKNWGEDFKIPNWIMLYGIKIVSLLRKCQQWTLGMFTPFTRYVALCP